MTKKDSGIHIVSVDVENFHRLRVAKAEVDPKAGLIRVTGKNRQGKTSLLRSIAAALGGGSEVLPAAVNTESEDGTGRVTLQLDNGFTVERRFTEAAPNGYLTVTGPDGGKFAQKKLGDWLGPRAFDPLALFDLKPKQMRDLFLSLGTDPDLGTKLAAVRAEQERVSEERRPYNSTKQRMARMERPTGEKPEPVDVSGEMGRLRDLRTVQAERDSMRQKIREGDLQASRHESRIGEIDAEIERLQAERETQSTLWKQAQASVKESEAALDDIADPSDEISEVEARVFEAGAINEALEPWKEYERAQKEAAEAGREAAKLTKRLQALRDDESALLENAGIPVPGLSFNENGDPLLSGLPVEVASGAERIQLAVDVAIAANPDLRVCLVDEANDMDLETLDALRQMAEEHGFQVWCCRIGIEGAGEIVVEDGEAMGTGK